MRRTWALAAALLLGGVAAPQLATAAPTTSTGPTVSSQPASGRESHSAPVYGSGRVTRRVETDEHIIALTLDDGYHPDPRILDLIQTWGLRGTAFIVGQVARDNPVLVRRLVDLGWEVCPHTWSHKNLTGLSDYEIYREMSRSQRIVNEVSGQHCPYFRPPNGAVDSRVIATADRLGLKVINWDASLSDSTKPGTDPQIQISLAFQYLRPGSILLGHFGAVNSYEVLKEVLSGTLGAGYRVGTVTELLQAAGEWVPPAATTQAVAQQPPAASANPAQPVVAKRVAANVASPPAQVLNNTKKVSNTTGFVRLAGALAMIFVVLLAFRARGGRRRLKQAAQKQLAQQRQREHSHQR